MSGTSLDGVDIAIMACDEHQCGLIYGGYQAYADDLKADLLHIQHHPVRLSQIAALDQQLAIIYSDIVLQALSATAIDGRAIEAIGCHGQTIFHHPDKGQTWQLGDPNLLAAKTQIRVVADFRRKDMAFGGQGAPLVPAFHQALFADKQKKRTLLNIGGIANVTVLSPCHDVLGYDTGPGNMLMDAWSMQQRQMAYDDGGVWARSGKLHQPLLTQLLNHPYFASAWPKSTGRDTFNLPWLQQQLDHFATIPAADVACTLTELTAMSITQSVQKHQTHGELFVCGGGVHNAFLLERLAIHLPNMTVESTQMLGVDPDYIEAMCFAWLAYRRLQGLSANLPRVTGARCDVTLGGVWHGD